MSFSPSTSKEKLTRFSLSGSYAVKVLFIEEKLSKQRNGIYRRRGTWGGKQTCETTTLKKQIVGEISWVESKLKLHFWKDFQKIFCEKTLNFWTNSELVILWLWLNLFDPTFLKNITKGFSNGITCQLCTSFKIEWLH